MRDKDPMPSQVLFTAASTPDLASSVDARWNQLFAAWLTRDALSRSNERFGPMSRANYESDQIEAVLHFEYGKGWRSNEEARARYAPYHERTSAEEEAIARDFYEPQTEAAIALALHPAPNLAAALFKIEMIKREELFNYEPMPRDPWEIVQEDLNRLSGEA